MSEPVLRGYEGTSFRFSDGSASELPPGITVKGPKPSPTVPGLFTYTIYNGTTNRAGNPRYVTVRDGDVKHTVLGVVNTLKRGRQEAGLDG